MATVCSRSADMGDIRGPIRSERNYFAIGYRFKYPTNGETAAEWWIGGGGLSTFRKETRPCRRVVKDNGAEGKEPVKEGEGVAVAALRIVSAPIAGSERRMNRVSRAMSRNAQNAGGLCEESKLTSVPRVLLTISAVRELSSEIAEYRND